MSCLFNYSRLCTASILVTLAVAVLLPFQATLVPQYIILKAMGILNTPATVVLPICRSLATSLAILCLALLGRSIRKGREFWNAQLKRRYPKEILEEYAVEALVSAIKAVVLLFLIALMVLGIIDFSFYLPQSILPQTYILNFSQWFSHPALSLPEISTYEQQCRTLLPALYQVGGACILCGSLALGLGIHCLKTGTRNKNQE